MQPATRTSLDLQVAQISGLHRDDLLREIEYTRERREAASTLREMAEWCVAYEEAIGGRPPTIGA